LEELGNIKGLEIFNFFFLEELGNIKGLEIFGPGFQGP
jgi:hypothetical protein